MRYDESIGDTMDIALDIIFYILSTLLGVAVGSFLNVCIYRLPRGTFFSKARSFCPKCGTPIKAYDNIPLLSYIILRGRCRACHERISPRYPIIEALNMILWIVNYALFGMSYWTLIADVLVSALIVVAMIDIDMTEIPTSSVVMIAILGLLAFIPNVGVATWQSMLIGAFAVSVPMLILWFFGAMGLGDVQLYFVLGLLFGWERVLVIFGLSMVMGAVGGLVNLAIVKHRKKSVVSEISPANEEKDGILAENTSIDSEHETAPLPSADEGDLGTAHSTSEESSERKASLRVTATDEEYEEALEEKLSAGKAIPFGPYIAAAAVLTLYIGKYIIDFYASLFGGL